MLWKPHQTRVPEWAQLSKLLSKREKIQGNFPGGGAQGGARGGAMWKAYVWKEIWKVNFI